MNIKNMITIALIEMKMTFRERVSFALVLIMPILMVFLMGNVMKPTFEAVDHKMEPFSILYINENKGAIGTGIDQFMVTQGTEYFEIIKPQSNDIEEEITSGGYPAAIVVNSDATIQIIGSGKHPMEESIVKSFIGNYILWMNTQSSLTQAAIAFNPTIDQMASMDAIEDVTQRYGYDFITEVTPEAPEERNLTSFQFFAASMMVFFLLTSGMGIGSSLIEGRVSKTFKRIHSFPIQKKDYLMGKIVGNSIIGMFQALCIILVTRYAFNVHWGMAPLGLALIVMVIIFISCALGIVFSNIINSSGALTAVMTIILWFMAFISGGFTGEPMLGFASRLTVNHWGFKAITTLMTGGVLIEILGSLSILIVIGLALWSIGLIVYNGRVSHE